MRSLLLVAALAAPAMAQKFTHNTPVKVEVKLTDRVKPPTVTEQAPAKPTVEAEQFLGIEERLSGVHTEQLGVLKDLADSATDPDEKADLLFRMAEMHAKLYRMHHLRAVEAEIKHVNAAPLQKKAKDALLEAVRVYTQLTGDEAFKHYAKMDSAYFYMAYTLQTGGYKEPARQAFARLLADFPQSKYVPEAHLAFGEAAFEAGQLADAEQRYRFVIKFPHSSVLDYALYKLGWVQLNQSKFQDALETFYKVTQLGTKTELYRAAKRDFVRAYAEVGRVDKALSAFERVDGGASPAGSGAAGRRGSIDKAGGFAMLGVLADLYMTQGKYDKAVFAYRELLTAKPRDAQACAWEYNVARAMLAAGQKGERVHEIEELVKLYGALKDKLPKAEAQECKEAASEMSGQLARAFHQEAVKTKNAELFGYADRLYRAYETQFADGDGRYWHAELRWAFAEIESTPQHWEDAARAFDAVTGVDPKLTQIAADAGMLAWMKALAIDPRIKQPQVADEDYAKIPAPKPIPERDQQLLAALDRYLARVKDDKDDERVGVMFHKANLLRRYDHYSEAMPIFADILARHREHETAEFAAQLMLDGYNRLQDYEHLIALAESLDKDPWTKDHDILRGVVHKIRIQAMRRGGEKLEREAKTYADYVACANQYVAIYNTNPEAPDADELLYNAGVCYERGKSMGAARLVYENLAKLYPKSKLTAKSIVRLGNVYAQTAFYREASEKLEEYAVKYGGERDAYGALSDAVAFRKGIGDDQIAIADTERVVRMASKPADAASAFWSLGAIYEKQGLDPQIAHLRAYLQRYRTSDPTRELAAFEKLGAALWMKACPVALVDGSCVRVDRELSLRKAKATCGDATKVKVTVVRRDEALARQAMAAFKQAVALTATGPSATFYRASALLGLAERDYENYLAVAIPDHLDFRPDTAARDRKRFDAWLDGKRATAQALEAQYQSVVKLAEGSTSIAAASRMGQVFESFSGQLFRADIPASLRTGPYHEEATQTYCDTLTEAADRLEKLAVQEYENCLVTSTRLGWFSDSSKVCERELGNLDPAKWPTAAEVHAAPDRIAMVLATEGAPQDLK